MDIKKCKLFALTAETGKISRTAELTGYTQSGVSHILKSFEKEVGITLFKRDRYGVHLTPLGADLLVYVKRYLAENEHLEQFIYDLHGLEVGSITIGTFTSVSIACLPEILKTFNESHPNIEIIIKEGGTDDMENWVSDMEVDLAFYSRQPRFRYDFIHLTDDPIVAVLPPAYSVSSDKKSFPVRDFSGKPFILSETGIDHDINRILTTTKVQPNILFSSKEDSTILAMVEQGLGLSILPSLSCTARPGTYQQLPLDPNFSRDLGIAIRSLNNAPPIVRSFIYAVRAYFENEEHA